jgi:hypothetical protein
MAELMSGKDATLKISQITLSNDTTYDRIKYASKDIHTKVVEQIKTCLAKIHLQFDESTDVSNCAQLLIFAWYIHMNEVKEELLFCEPLKETK